MTKLLPTVCMDCGHRFATTASWLFDDGACRKCASDDLDLDASVEGQLDRPTASRQSAKVAAMSRSIREHNPQVSAAQAVSMAREAVRKYPGVAR